ncbi:hypothetical protein K474DRAFT_1694643 [Panus rudis PR-1116 ss-1]|nr:hypothetical protein K474DRAFT_1694643 [Panus rudis PR-1116 ss-1]
MSDSNSVNLVLELELELNSTVINLCHDEEIKEEIVEAAAWCPNKSGPGTATIGKNGEERDASYLSPRKIHTERAAASPRAVGSPVTQGLLTAMEGTSATTQDSPSTAGRLASLMSYATSFLGSGSGTQLQIDSRNADLVEDGPGNATHAEPQGLGPQNPNNQGSKAKVNNTIADPDVGKPCTKGTHADSPPTSTAIALYRCLYCINPPILCKECMVESHRWNPFHYIQFWNGDCFERTTLWDLGFVLPLGHRGQDCPNSILNADGRPSSTSKLTVVHTTGIQDIEVLYCNCPSSASNLDPEERPTQLWKANLWPATYQCTQTAFSVHSLRFFEQLTLQAKTSAHDYFGVLRRLTNNAFFRDVHDRYREFMTGSRQFSFLHSLKRAGVRVVEKLAPGRLAVPCPTCPQPGINMDPGWEDRPREEWYVDALHYGKDGFFQANQHNKKMDHLDPALTDGAAYFVDSTEYSEYLKEMNQYPDVQEETSICSKFSALIDKYAGKLKSGILSLTCTRHEFALPCGTVDLFKGERYVNVDFATIKGLSPWMRLKQFVSSYDINCKYGINWESRLSRFAQFTGNCCWINSFYFMPGVGMTDGEAVERRWSTLLALTRSTREMPGSGFRYDTWNLHTSDHNIQKMFRIANVLADRFKKALASFAEKATELQDMEATLRESQLPLDEWKREEAHFLELVVQPDAHKKIVKSPYETRDQKDMFTTPTTKEIEAELHQQEANKDGSGTGRRVKRKLESGTSAGVSKSTCDPDDTEFECPEYILRGMATALDIQSQQHKVQGLQLRKKNQNTSETSLEDQRNKLSEALREWMTSWYSPVLAPLIKAIKNELPNVAWAAEDDQDLTIGHPEEEIMPLPSSWPSVAMQFSELTPFIRAEHKLRREQADEMWREIQGSFGQAVKTRNQTAIQSVEQKIRDLRETYQSIHKKLLMLGESPESSKYRLLTEEDCRPMPLEHEQDKTGGKNSTISWIWRDGGYHRDPSVWEREANRVDWFRKSAQVSRWREEVEILKVEIRRTQRSFAYNKDLWEKRARDAALSDSAIERGVAAYAHRQSRIYARLLDDARAVFPTDLHVDFEEESCSLDTTT